MPIVYKIDIMKLLREKGYTTYTLRKKNILSQSTIECLRDKKPISFDTLAKICEILNMQPSDIIEYVPDTITKPNLDPDVIEEYFQDELHRQDLENWRQQHYGNK